MIYVLLAIGIAALLGAIFGPVLLVYIRFGRNRERAELAAHARRYAELVERIEMHRRGDEVESYSEILNRIERRALADVEHEQDASLFIAADHFVQHNGKWN